MKMKVNIMNETFENNKFEIYEMLEKHGKYDYDLCKRVKDWFYLQGVDLDGITPVYSLAESRVTGIQCLYILNKRHCTLYIEKNSYKISEIK